MLLRHGLIFFSASDIIRNSGFKLLENSSLNSRKHFNRVVNCKNAGTLIYVEGKKLLKIFSLYFSD